jgi:hypothetical protein
MTTDQLTEALKQAQQRAAKLSPDRQDNVAKEILRETEEEECDEKWDALLNSPEADAYAARRREEVIAEHLAGKTKKYIPGKSIAELFGIG